MGCAEVREPQHGGVFVINTRGIGGDRTVSMLTKQHEGEGDDDEHDHGHASPCSCTAPSRGNHGLQHLQLATPDSWPCWPCEPLEPRCGSEFRCACPVLPVQHLQCNAMQCTSLQTTIQCLDKTEDPQCPFGTRYGWAYPRQHTPRSSCIPSQPNHHTPTPPIHSHTCTHTHTHTHSSSRGYRSMSKQATTAVASPWASRRPSQPSQHAIASHTTLHCTTRR
jgi:hypothetical protein